MGERSYVKDDADRDIEHCLNQVDPVSFFLFAGAGSGKTGSLVSALRHILDTQARQLRLSNQKVAVITYTVAASEEIIERIRFDPLVEVSTIHSFIWTLIRGFDRDIKKWVTTNLQLEIEELEEQHARGRAGKAATAREKRMVSKRKRLAALAHVKRFTYNPTGENRGRDALNHAEVVRLGAEFLKNAPLMRSLLVNRYPILFIDESQDTTRALIEAFMLVEERERSRFRLGLFGDMMQRIYTDGKQDLGRALPATWAKPKKLINHRSPRRIIELINKLRNAVDGHAQNPREDADEGVVRLFLVNGAATDKTAIEGLVRERMAAITADTKWSTTSDVKTLILEHRMAAKRLGFLDMFSSLYDADSLRTGFLDGSLSGLQVFSRQILPLVRSAAANDDFAVAAIVRKYSPLLSREVLQRVDVHQPDQIKKAREGAQRLLKLFEGDKKPTFGEVLQCVQETNLFEVPDALRAIALRVGAEPAGTVATPDASIFEDYGDPVLDAWESFLATPFAQIEPYIDYVEERSPFDTHQGIKGREFPRVLVIIDDEDARGFTFSYEKFFGAKTRSATDVENEQQGKETTIDRTRRLFYVTCSRAMTSLAVVAYTGSVAAVRDHILQQGWFTEGEIETLS